MPPFARPAGGRRRSLEVAQIRNVALLWRRSPYGHPATHRARLVLHQLRSAKARRPATASASGRLGHWSSCEIYIASLIKPATTSAPIFSATSYAHLPAFPREAITPSRFPVFASP